jgi:hypothetical protein
MIIAKSSLSGNNISKTANNSIRDFTVLKHFNVNIHNPKAPVIKEVLWCPPLINWHKCNTDGASLGSTGVSSCGGIFGYHAANFCPVLLNHLVSLHLIRQNLVEQ